MAGVLLMSVWVNRDYIAGFITSTEPTSTSNASTNNATMPGPLPGGLPPAATPMGETHPDTDNEKHAGRIAGSRLPTERLPDPFLHGTSADAPVAAARNNAPVVRMLLHTDRGAMAMIDDRLVAVGDRIAIGTVATVAADRVVVRSDTNESIELLLQASGARRFVRPNKKAPAAEGAPAAAATATGAGAIPDLLESLQTGLKLNQPLPAAQVPAAAGSTRR
jgi:hypothetical protein